MTSNKVPTIHDVLANTDWKYLARQNVALVEACRDNEHLEGLLCWIDAIQDAAEAEDFPVVWLTGKDK